MSTVNNVSCNQRSIHDYIRTRKDAPTAAAIWWTHITGNTKEFCRLMQHSPELEVLNSDVKPVYEKIVQYNIFLRTLHRWIHADIKRFGYSSMSVSFYPCAALSEICRLSGLTTDDMQWPLMTTMDITRDRVEVKHHCGQSYTVWG